MLFITLSVIFRQLEVSNIRNKVSFCIIVKHMKERTGFGGTNILPYMYTSKYVIYHCLSA